jgi:hypothetical protein
MIINIIYNDLNKKIDFDLNIKIGEIQNKILSECSLLIYNIEYSEFKSCNNNNKLILGIDQCSYNIILKDFIEIFLDISNNIEIITYDRKRDINGNVIKENMIIDKYNEWFNKYENEKFLNNYSIENNTSNQNFTYTNNQILRFPITNILNNIFRSPNIEINSNESDDDVPDLIENNNESNLPELIDNESDIPDLIDINNELNNIIYDTINNRINNNIYNRHYNFTTLLNNRIQENIISENTFSENPVSENTFSENPVSENPVSENTFSENSVYRRSRFNNIINIFDNYLSNINRDNLNTRNYGFEFYEPSNNINTFENLEDVKVVLNEDTFNNLERVNFEDLDKESQNDCLICIDSFEDKDEIVKIKCNHIFHCNCIKSWLCNESNKCPVCRIDVDKGTILE